MMGFVLKDLLSLKKTYVLYAAVMILYVAFSAASDSNSMLICIAMLFCAMMPLTSLSYDEAAKWDKYALTFPVSRNALIGAKYILTLLMCGVGALASIGISFVLSYVKHQTIQVEENLMILLPALGIALLFASIILPLVVMLGAERSRIALLGVVIVPTVLALLFGKMGVTISEETVMTCIKAAPIIGLAVFGLSWRVTCALYRKREL